jgi:hypothetical protein
MAESRLRTHNEFLEAIAEAMFASDANPETPDRKPWQRVSYDLKQYYRRHASVALEMMEKRTP